MNTTVQRSTSNVKDLLKSEAAFRQIESVAAKHINGERMARVMANACRVTPALYDCEPMSFLGAMMTAASLGLEVNTPQGHAYLIPFNNNRKNPQTGRWEKTKEAQLIIGYKGYIDLAFRSGVLTYIDAGIHYSDDDLWEYEKGSNFQLRHAEGPQQGEKLHAYAIVKWGGGDRQEGTAAVVLPWSKVMSTRDQSQGWQMAVRNGKTEKSPWHTHEDAMAMKTAIRALANTGRMPMSIEMQNAHEVDGSKNIDYRGIASKPVTPSSGMIIDTTPISETDKPESNEIDPSDFIEDADEKPADPEPKKEPVKEPAKKEVKPKEKAKPKPREKTDYTEKPSEAEGNDGGDQEENAPAADAGKTALEIKEQILGDLMDAGPAAKNEVLQSYAKDLAMLQSDAPEMFKEVEQFAADMDD